MILKGCRRIFALSSPVSRIRANYSSTAAASAESHGSPLDVGQSTIPPPSEGVRNISARVESLVEQIVSLPLLEVSDLNCALKKRLNIPDTPFMPSGMMMPMMSAATGTAAAAAAAAAEEATPETAAPQKISFSVKLTKFDATKKIALIKQIRDLIPGLNLVQAKKFVESAPVEVKTDLGQNEADEIKAAIEKVGGEAEIV